MQAPSQPVPILKSGLEAPLSRKLQEKTTPLPADHVYLSVVIPAHGASAAQSLERVKAYLRERPYRSELLVVSDGSTPPTEGVTIVDVYRQELHEQRPGKPLDNPAGKGGSIARGLLEARGQIVLFTDGNLATPIEDVEKLLPHFEAGYSVVIGSRKLAAAPQEAARPLRRLARKGLHRLVQWLAVPDIEDTQCGFKAYRREVAHRLAALQKLDGFAFDVEHLYLARKLGLSIKEVGVRWADRERSLEDPLRGSYRELCDLLKIRFHHRNLRSAA